jgi:hypothetical protein
MKGNLVFWILLGFIVFSWEALIFNPSRILFWFFICVVSSILLAFFVTKSHRFSWRKIVLNGFGILFFSTGVFWWMLWLDFAFLKFVFPIIIGLAFAYVIFLALKYRGQDFPKSVKLALFSGGTFFWSSISFGLVITIGWSLWESLLVFLIPFSVFAGIAIKDSFSKDNNQEESQDIKFFDYSGIIYFLLLLLAAEIFSCLIWLPFTEVTLAFLLTIMLLFFYDLSKYIVNPKLISRKIIAEKVIIYFVFIVLVVLSTPWF